MKVMIVDDHAAFRHMLRVFLEAPGVECVECGDGDEALNVYAVVRPDLVLMDVAMQGLDGLNATAQIIRRFPEARVFMLTQYDDPDLREAARDEGASGYLLKDDLSKVRALVQSRPSQPNPPSTRI